MKCLLCGFENPATISYCKKCGKKVDLSHEEIKAALHEKAEQESAKNVEYQATQFVVLAAAFFLLMLTLKILASSMRPDEERLVFIPSVSVGDRATYAETPYEFIPPLGYDLLPPDVPGK
jgi:uncharacterized membrane protein YvbJ